jgi:hypothetical protein
MKMRTCASLGAGTNSTFAGSYTESGWPTPLARTRAYAKFRARAWDSWWCGFAPVWRGITSPARGTKRLRSAICVFHTGRRNCSAVGFTSNRKEYSYEEDFACYCRVLPRVDCERECGHFLRSQLARWRAQRPRRNLSRHKRNQWGVETTVGTNKGRGVLSAP